MKEALVALFSGAGIGLAIGVMMGLAVSPTVGVIIGTLASLLAVLLGLNDKHFTRAKGLRIGAFGFATVLGALFGIYIRAHNILSPGIEEQKAQYIRMGYTQKQALDFIAYKNFGILNEDWKMAGVVQTPVPDDGDTDDESTAVASKQQKPSKKATDKNQKKRKKKTKKRAVAAQKTETPIVQYTESLVQRQNSSVLFSSEVDLSACAELEKASAEVPLNYFLNYFETMGGEWRQLAVNVQQHTPTDRHKPILLTLKNTICAGKTAEFADEDCKRLDWRTDTPTTEMFVQLEEMAGIWGRLGRGVRVDTEPGEHRSVLLVLRKTFCEG